MNNIKSTFTKSLLVIGLLSISTIASAADLPKAFDYSNASTNYVDNTSSGRVGTDLFGKSYYLGGTIGQSEAGSYCSGASACEDSDTAWKLFGGYKILEKVSIEGAYLNLGDIRKDGQNSDVSAIAGYAVGAIPVTERFDAFAKLGGAYWKSENTDGKQSGFGLAYGLGAKMKLNETTKLRAEWEKVSGVETSSTDETDVSMLSVGVEITTF